MHLMNYLVCEQDDKSDQQIVACKLAFIRQLIAKKAGRVTVSFGKSSKTNFVTSPHIPKPALTHSRVFSVPASVVQRAVNSIQCINLYPTDKMYSNQNIFSIRWIGTYPLDKVIRSLNNLGLTFRHAALFPVVY